MNDDPSPSSYPQPKSLIDRIGLFLTGEPKDRDDLLSILRDAKDNNVLDAEALFMIQSVLQFSEKRVRDVMIPRIQMNVFSKDADLESVIPQVLEYGHSRFPVIEDDRSKVVGVLLAKDLLAHLSAGSKLKVGDLMRPVSLVPESKRR